ncbi:type II toxin-antitoxin system death-on-curing family toxin [Luteimonas dalianensis]|uniref:type II toxin-antitoxin system death-on-curing family toxin n=1 Tax=Luteimonas dalianensis TaxID=1148196 RepID=UPI003BF14AAC
MIRWIEKPFALAIHDRQLAEHGGSAGVRDESLPDSALARPQQLHAYGEPPPDVADLTASLAYGLARNHPFVDGNNRTAHVCYRAFLALNGLTVAASDEDKYATMVALADGSLPEADFAAWLRERIRREPGADVHEPQAKYAHPG